VEIRRKSAAMRDVNLPGPTIQWGTQGTKASLVSTETNLFILLMPTYDLAYFLKATVTKKKRLITLTPGISKEATALNSVLHPSGFQFLQAILWFV
jgi:hypothetical protein